MKIAQVVCVYPPYAGGIGTSAFNIQKILQTEQEAVVFTNKTRKEASGKEDNVFRVSPLLRLGHGSVMISLLWKLKKFDLIYFHYPFFGTAIIIWFLKTIYPKKRIFIHYHMDVKHKNIIYKILSWPEKIIEKSLFKKSEVVISSSLDYIENSQIKNIYKKYPQKFKEIPFSVDTEIFTPLPENEEKENFILFVGGLDKAHYFKGVDILIKAFADLNIKNAILVIAGEGDLKEEYQKEVVRLNISEKVFFPGKLSKEDLIKKYQKARVLVLPSINSNEAFGIVLIEAMACKTPVIASSLAGVRSVFEDGRSGFLVKPGCPVDLKDKLYKLLEEKGLDDKMGYEALKLVKERYSDKVINEKILKLFK
jgi:glycosyltransferase involved in cell wall biosynthesis